VASMITFAEPPFEGAVVSIADALRSLDDYKRCGNTLFIRYEEMMADRPAQIRRIAEYLGVALDGKLVARIDEMTSMQQSRRISESLRLRSETQVVRFRDHRVDPETWLHDNHIRSGKTGRW